MYRIELSPGEETAFRSIEELAVAIRRRVVTSHARIWHNASGKWLPIQFHPHYKIAASMELTTADLVAGPPVKKLDLLTLGELMDPPAPPARAAAPPEPPPQAPRARRAPEPEPKPKPRKKAAPKARRGRSARGAMRVALGGALLIACAHLAFSATSVASSEETAVRPRSHRRLVTVPTNSALEGKPETTAAAVLPSLPSVPRPSLRPSSVARPAAPAPLESQSGAATPPLGAFDTDSGSGVQPAPESVDISTAAPLTGDAVARKMVDSTGKKTLKRILGTIGGTSTAEPSRPKR